MIKKENIANNITILRIVVSAFMLFFDPTSLIFMILYLIASLSDVLDGFVARKINIQSQVGSKLDTISDTIFFIVFSIKIWKLLNFQTWEIVLLLIILLIKSFSILFNCIFKHSFIVDVHSIFNKITGVCLFLLPITINLSYDKYYIYFLLVLAFIASIDEMFNVISEYNAMRLNIVK